MGLLVWAGRRGGGGLAPGSSEGVAAASETRRAARLPMNCSPGLQRKERGVRLTAMKGGSVTGPDVGLSSGCCVGPELIEGES